MKATTIIKRAVYYLVFLSAFCLAYYFLISLMSVMYIKEAENLTGSFVLQKIYLPTLYAALSLAIGLLMERLLLLTSKGVEDKISSIVIIAFNGAYFLFAVIVLIVGLKNLNTTGETPAFLLIPFVVIALFSLGEVALGIFRLVGYGKNEKSLESIRKSAETTDSKM